MPGSGKTTLALQFLLEGVRRGEPVLYVTLSETEEELRAVARVARLVARRHRRFASSSPSEESLRPDDQYTMFHPSEVELTETTKTILADVGPAQADAASSSIRCPSCACSPATRLRYRRQILALKQFFVGRKCTVAAARRHDEQRTTTCRCRASRTA